MFCKNCGTEIPEGETKCPNCGESTMNSNNIVQQPQPYYQPYPPTPAQQIVVNSAPTQQSNGCATAGFVLSLIGFLLGFTLIFSILGLILSIVGLAKAKSVNGTGKGLAIAGLVLSILSLISGIFLFIWFLRLITAGVSSFSGAAPLLSSVL